MAISFDELTKKTKDAANAAAAMAKDAAELVKINVAIAGEQRELDKKYRAIGLWYADSHEGEVPEEIQDLLDAVAASKERIAELEASKPAKEEGEVEEPAEEGEKACPVCGAPSDSKFCPQCGAPMDE